MTLSESYFISHDAKKEKSHIPLASHDKVIASFTFRNQKLAAIWFSFSFWVLSAQQSSTQPSSNDSVFLLVNVNFKLTQLVLPRTSFFYSLMGSFPIGKVKYLSQNVLLSK